jgi:hypothetical protein
MLLADGGGMSDFLSRLVGRSLGPSRAIQPRVPSLYEPHRKGRGPVWARHALQEQDAGREPQDRQLQEEDRREVDSNSEEETSETQLRAREPLRPLRPAQRAAVVSEAQPAEASFSRPLEPGPVPPAVAQMREENVSRVEIPHAPQAANVAKGAVTPDFGAHPSANETPSAESSRAMRFTSLQPTTSVHPAAGNDAASNFEIENSGLRVAEARTAAQRVDQSLTVKSANAVSTIAGTISRNLPLPSLVPTASVATPLMATPAAIPAVLALPSARPQRHQASDLGNINAAVRNATAAEPAVRVSIGRVEVRAVFPAAPVRRAQAARAKPGLSLDDYLKRPKRGQQ